MTDPCAAFRLDGRVAVVTGASSGLGASFATVLARAGADVVVAARRRDMLDTVAEAVLAEGRRCLAVPTDVTDPAQCTALVDVAVEELGGVHVLINNAGAGYARRSERDDPLRAARLLEVNLLGAYQVAVAAGQAMIAGERGGSVVNISSALALTTTELPQAAYSASKAGLLGMTRDLARQWARHGIRVNALAPGFFSSEMTAPLLSHESSAESVRSVTALGRIGRVDELAGPLLLLASDAGSYITGTTLGVDGGMAMH
ncbi:NAD(P)-dependent dehydrogenase (short-subunit alcohol dehydrogenase family) [Actinomycetospora succinea]|uniref:NAD(P)-dependent dehydrogenase (Short-subunit alcohol dehydrogenase family) n=1 Tax=Actinomycetospora succinea TaxID=663603 RepID=A0A4R6UX82_9PSEU|nr:SDR family oxidoreductase [Actinomycetospora succinea]TDQ50896.1 NAD(P)-dependent dehydrogenase (short-subunit alcohol dehydrogenase family) [Actinomycetospora succinea]